MLSVDDLTVENDHDLVTGWDDDQVVLLLRHDLYFIDDRAQLLK